MLQGSSRKNRHHLRRARRRRGGELNIVSMIDVLTVLVFFLLVNASGVSVLGVNLPAPSSDAAPRPHQLTLSVRHRGPTLADNGDVIGRLPGLIDGHYDLAALSQLLAKVKARMAGESQITLLLEPGIRYDTLVAIMDAVRTAPSDHRTLFPDISLGDAGNEVAYSAMAGAPGAAP